MLFHFGVLTGCIAMFLKCILFHTNVNNQIIAITLAEDQINGAV